MQRPDRMQAKRFKIKIQKHEYFIFHFYRSGMDFQERPVRSSKKRKIQLQLSAQSGRVKRSATINCDIVNVDCSFLTMGIYLNETCRAMEYPAVPMSGAGLYVTNSTGFKVDSIEEGIK